MQLETLIEDAKNSKYLVLSEHDLEVLLSSSKVLNEAETLISDKIRLLEFKNELLVQEKTDRDEFLIRLMNTKKDADVFIKERLEVYDRMWDGCGCKVEYY